MLSRVGVQDTGKIEHRARQLTAAAAIIDYNDLRREEVHMGAQVL